MKKWLLALVCAGALLFAGAQAEEYSVVATNFPCYDFARQVAGEICKVELLIRPGAEVHSFEPSPSDILRIGGADLFVCIGGESDVWAEDILNSFGEDAPATVRLIESVETLHEDHGEEEHASTEAGEWDEHIWTSPKNAVKMVNSVADALCAVLPEHETEFRRRAEDYIVQINAIDAQLEKIVANGSRRELVFADRFPFLYLAHDYGLTYSAAFTSCASETEPSAQVMVQLIQRIIEDRIPVVYTIEMSTGAIARTLCEETGVQSMTMHSIQTVTQEEFDAGETYVSLMTKNLEAIRMGLS